MTWPLKHFTADDLDAFHSEALSEESRLHLETCPNCSKLVAEDRRLLTLLNQLETLAPSASFADRVMAKVTVGSRTVPVLSFPRLSRRRLATVVALAAGLVASVAWSAANRPLLESWLSNQGAALASYGWTAVRALGANLTEQPWYADVAAVLGSPTRLILTSVIGLAIYATGVVALRRLVTPSIEPGHHVNA